MNAAKPHVSPEHTGIRILAVGDLHAGTDLDLLLRAFQGVARWQPEARLVIAGEGPERPALEERIAALGLSESVGMPGALSPIQVAALMQRAHVCVVPDSRSAVGIPPALPIAMAGGLCVIGVLGGVAATLVRDGLSGLLVVPGDFEALSRALHLAVSNGDLRRQLGEAAAASIHDHTPHRKSA